VQNPRPRKYASDAEWQAAFRNRASMLEFRADEKTAEKLTEIATTLDISRSDLLLSMVKFALTNHQWARFGLTHKTLPRYEENPIMASTQGALEKSIFWQNQVLKQSRDPKQKERVKKAIEKLQAELDSLMERKTNPTTKKFSPAQIAAQKLFAERARAGTLGKGTKRRAVVKRKANPVTETLIYGLAPGETRDYMEELMYAGGQKLTQAQIDKVFKAASDAGYHSFRVAGFDPTMKPDFAAAVRRKRNPDKAKPRAYVKRATKPKYSAAAVNKAIASSRSKISASEGKTIHRLLKGRHGNPAASMMTAYQVICMHPKQHVVGIFKTMAEAKQIATALANAKGVAYGVKAVKVHKAHFAA